MNIDCTITDLIQRDFNALWKCQQRGNTLEITTPYLLPDSTLVSLFVTEKENRYIISDGGGIHEILAEYCTLPSDEITSALQGYAAKFHLKEGALSDGAPHFFKECSDLK